MGLLITLEASSRMDSMVIVFTDFSLTLLMAQRSATVHATIPHVLFDFIQHQYLRAPVTTLSGRKKCFDHQP